jgi:hypothetical protein
MKLKIKLIKIKMFLLRKNQRKIVIIIFNLNKNSQKIQDQQIIITKPLMNQEQQSQKKLRKTGILQIILYRSHKLHMNLNLMKILKKLTQIKM